MALALTWPLDNGHMALSLALALAVSSKVVALALRGVLTIFWHYPETRGLTTTATVKLKVCLGQCYSND